MRIYGLSKREKGLSEALKAKRGFDNEFDL